MRNALLDDDLGVAGEEAEQQRRARPTQACNDRRPEGAATPSGYGPGSAYPPQRDRAAAR